MKRSEAVEALAEAIERLHNKHGSLDNFKLVAHEFLEYVEAMGMLPPMPYHLIKHDAVTIWEPEKMNIPGCLTGDR
jgi:predicted translin family RNA/ssDNA-binding protein